MRQPISFSDFRVGGDLPHRAVRNFDRLERDDYQPPTLFRGNEGWPGDLEGREILGLTLLAQATQRPARFLDETLRLFPARMNARGYFGEVHPAGMVSEQQLAGHGWVLRGLCEHFQWTEDGRTLEMIQKIVQNLALPTRGAHRSYPIDPTRRRHEGSHAGTTVDHQENWLLSSDTGCDFIFLDGAVHAYEVLKIPELADLIEEMIARYLEMDLVSLQAQTHATLTGMRALLRYHRLADRPEMPAAVEARYRTYCSAAMSENYANWNWFGRPTWTEPCAVVDAFLVAVALWEETGHARYLEDAHLMYFNALGHGQRHNGGFGCDTCAGTDTLWTEDGGLDVRFSPFLKISVDEAPWCCTMRGAEGLSRAAQYSFFTGPEELVLPFYFEGDATLRIGDRTLEARLSTGYPFDGRVRLEILRANGPAAPVTVRFFAPSWTKNHRLTRNGVELASRAANGFLAADTPLAQGDTLALFADLETGTQPVFNPASSAGYGTFRHGPLILGCDTSEEIRVPAGAELEPMGRSRFQVKGTQIVLGALNDMQERKAGRDSYCRQVLFR